MLQECHRRSSAIKAERLRINCYSRDSHFRHSTHLCFVQNGDERSPTIGSTRGDLEVRIVVAFGGDSGQQAAVVAIAVDRLQQVRLHPLETSDAVSQGDSLLVVVDVALVALVDAAGSAAETGRAARVARQVTAPQLSPATFLSMKVSDILDRRSGDVWLWKGSISVRFSVRHGCLNSHSVQLLVPFRTFLRCSADMT